MDLDKGEKIIIGASSLEQFGAVKENPRGRAEKVPLLEAVVKSLNAVWLRVKAKGCCTQLLSLDGDILLT
jgi:hypothetical protein